MRGAKKGKTRRMLRRQRHASSAMSVTAFKLRYHNRWRSRKIRSAAWNILSARWISVRVGARPRVRLRMRCISLLGQLIDLGTRFLAAVNAERAEKPWNARQSRARFPEIARAVPNPSQT
jgi:hypothetical protein